METRPEGAFIETWEQCRKHANDLGIPGWLLAEDLGMHGLGEEVVLKRSVKVELGGIELDARRSK